jgi:hypothetical protein
MGENAAKPVKTNIPFYDSRTVSRGANTLSRFGMCWFRRVIRCRLLLVLPHEPLPAWQKTRKVTTAGRAAVRRRADSQSDSHSQRRTVILLAPRGEFLPVATWAPGVFPICDRPDTGLPAMLAAAATQVVDADPALHEFGEGAVM